MVSMSSLSAPRRVRFVLTGFGSFNGVPQNPTETIVKSFRSFVNLQPLPSFATLSQTVVVPVAGKSAFEILAQVTQKEMAAHKEEATAEGEGDEDPMVIFVHLGVDCGASEFSIERRAVNSAQFRCPDNDGWQPKDEVIDLREGGQATCIYTGLPVDTIVAELSKQGYRCHPSLDAGRFLCNYLYYRSFQLGRVHGPRVQNLFVHMPPFTKVPAAKQVDFVDSLLRTLCRAEVLAIARPHARGTLTAAPEGYNLGGTSEEEWSGIVSATKSGARVDPFAAAKAKRRPVSLDVSTPSERENLAPLEATGKGGACGGGKVQEKESLRDTLKDMGWWLQANGFRGDKAVQSPAKKGRPPSFSGDTLC